MTTVIRLHSDESMRCTEGSRTELLGGEVVNREVDPVQIVPFSVTPISPRGRFAWRRRSVFSFDGVKSCPIVEP